jgi:hypothetical protein
MAIKQEHPEQNFSFHRRGINGQVVVSNNLSYSMAEYNEHTGVTRWQRVVPATQREKVQKFLSEQYPVITAPATNRNSRRAKAA